MDKVKEVSQDIEQFLHKQTGRVSHKTKTYAHKLATRYINNKNKAQEFLKNEEEVERFLERLERKLRKFPGVGKQLSYIPTMISLIRSYIHKEYTDLPLGSILGVLAALMYFASPIDLIPDAIPILGFSDDIALIAYVWNLIGDDVEEYDEWRKKNGKYQLYK